ncbi:MAG TPA: hypothetical protein VIN59_04730, partial [Alphaproteobacteria bacterium]
MSYTYDWPQASPCSNILIYTREGSILNLLTTQRTSKVGIGRALSAGGFNEVKDMFNEVGKISEGDAETYREMHEELGEAIKQIIPYEDFHERQEYVWDFMRRVRDTIGVESVITRSLEVSQAEMDAILALSSTEEQNGKVIERFDLAKTTEDSIRARLSDFHYAHEAEATVRWFKKLQKKLGYTDPKPALRLS